MTCLRNGPQAGSLLDLAIPSKTCIPDGPSVNSIPRKIFRQVLPTTRNRNRETTTSLLLLHYYYCYYHYYDYYSHRQYYHCIPNCHLDQEGLLAEITSVLVIGRLRIWQNERYKGIMGFPMQDRAAVVCRQQC